MPTATKSMILRLDTELMAALEARADKERLSREGLVRRLIWTGIGIKPKQQAQGLWRQRFGTDSPDARVAKARERMKPKKPAKKARKRSK